MPLAGDPIKASDLYDLRTFTPTWVNVTTGSGAVNEGWWLRSGDLVHWGVRLEFGTSPAFSSTIAMNLPVTAWTGGGSGFQMTIGAWICRLGGSSHWAGSAGIYDSGGTQVSFAGAKASGGDPDARLGQGGSSPSPTSGGILSATGSYRAA